MENGFSSPRSESFLTGLCVLVVDDDPTWLKILEKMLKKCAYDGGFLKLCVSSSIMASGNLLGEDLGPLNTNDLERLERQLDSSLKQVRSTKLPGRQLEILSV